MDTIIFRSFQKLLVVGLVATLGGGLAGCPSPPATIGESDTGQNDESEDDDAGENANADANGQEECGGEADYELCEEAGADCGQIEVEDSCGDLQEADCGECGSVESCGAGDAGPNQCGCSPIEAEECEQEFGADCGTHSDGCGGEVECSDCPDEQTCSPENGEYRCIEGSCESMSCDELEIEEDVECGVHSDGCGETLNCGGCDGEEDACVDNTCTCQYRGDEWFCNEYDADCDPITGEDNCGSQRTVDCGGCGWATSCDDNECRIL